MDLVFNHLIQRETPQPIIKIGTPWQCIPIKNDKQARDTTEVHMSHQGINELQQFEKFMNLEVVWLNGNNLKSIKGIENNFRIKQLYLQENKISTLDGMDNLKHLETLSLFNNELRNLEKNLETIKLFPSLKQLDLFNNPLAEEPYYRNRVISALPQLQLLDRHVITVQERIKVDKWYKDFKSDVKIKKKSNKSKLLPSQIFSKGENLLYKEVEDIKNQREQALKNELEMEKTRIKAKEKTFDPNKLPTNELKEQLNRRRKEDPLSVITEWEKGRLKKIFKSYDKEKKASITQDKLQGIYQDLVQDVANIGKVPAIDFEEFKKIMVEDPLPWDTFCFNLNNVIFKKAPDDSLETKINDKYREFNRKLNIGKKAEAKEYMFEVMKLEAARDMTEHKLPPPKIIDNSVKRTDFYNFDKYKFKNTFKDESTYKL